MLRCNLVVAATQRVAVVGLVQHLVLTLLLAVPVALATLERLELGRPILAFRVVVHEGEVHLGLVSHVHFLR